MLVLLVLLAGVSCSSGDELHWSFRKLAPLPPPNRAVTDSRPGNVEQPRSGIDLFIRAKLSEHGLAPSPPADRAALLRRLTFDLIGLPPDPDDVASFRDSTRPDAVEREMDRLLALPEYGERWGKYWLDAVGYADSNGYFNADSDRPLAFKYRDYVIQSLNKDKPYAQFVREQLAGDELCGYQPDAPVTEEMIEQLQATHFLRNSQDGTGESDGNPDELTVDRATVLEGAMQVSMNSLLGLTIQCARCHEHKFEPIAHADYYRLQAVFYPAFPALHVDRWAKPNERTAHVATPDMLTEWETNSRKLQAGLAAARESFLEAVRSARTSGHVLLADDFGAAPESLEEHWSATAPGDDAPGGTPSVQLNSDSAPAARVVDGQLRIIEVGGAGNRWLSTREKFDWTPDRQGDSIQVTFALVANHVGESSPAERIGYYIALHDYHDNGSTPRGNLLIDGNPAGGAALHVDYPGDDAESVGTIGKSGYEPGHHYGVRVTNDGGGKFRVEQLVDFLPEERAVTLAERDLPDGGFGFEFCCGRSFIVDDVVIETTSPLSDPDQEARRQQGIAAMKVGLDAFQRATRELANHRHQQPGHLAWVVDRMVPAPTLHLLQRGQYAQPGQTVEPAGLGALTDDGAPYVVPDLAPGAATTGRRLALADWLTRQDSRSAALLHRVIANRVWQHHFGAGIVATPDNLGQSGARPTHPELLEFLAAELTRAGGSLKTLHRRILASSVYQQASSARDDALAVDADNRWLWRYPLRRLDAESIRDAMLAVGGDLEPRLFGPYTPTTLSGDGSVEVDPGHRDSRRRGIYMQQRRTQTHTMLGLFDAPAMAVTCGERSRSTVPLQSLALLNGPFTRQQAESFARRLAAEVPTDNDARVRRAFLLATGREPTNDEALAAREFLLEQSRLHGAQPVDGKPVSNRALTDLCQMLFASNAFLYVE